MGSTGFFFKWTFCTNRTFKAWAKYLQLLYASKAKFWPNGLSSYNWPPLVSNHLGLTFWVVAYGRFDCSFRLFCIKLFFCLGRYAEDIAKVQKQYPSEPFKFLEPRFAPVRLFLYFLKLWKFFMVFRICSTSIGEGLGEGVEKRNQENGCRLIAWYFIGKEGQQDGSVFKLSCDSGLGRQIWNWLINA